MAIFALARRESRCECDVIALQPITQARGDSVPFFVWSGVGRRNRRRLPLEILDARFIAA